MATFNLAVKTCRNRFQHLEIFWENVRIMNSLYKYQSLAKDQHSEREGTMSTDISSPSVIFSFLFFYESIKVSYICGP